MCPDGPAKGESMAVKVAIKKIDQAAAKGHMTKQAASRAKSKLAKAANAAK